MLSKRPLRSAGCYALISFHRHVMVLMVQSWHVARKSHSTTSAPVLRVGKLIPQLGLYGMSSSRFGNINMPSPVEFGGPPSERGEAAT